MDDVRGAVRLAADATGSVTRIVESMHATIASGSLPFGVAAKPQARGIAGLVYRGVREVSGHVGLGIDGVLGALSLLVADAASTAQREAVVAALNGVLGDHLEASGNPLAIRMGFRVDGRALPLQPQPVADALAQPRDRLLIAVHGLCMNDLQWCWNGMSLPQLLAEDLGSSLVFLHYNTGRHIWRNGEDFAECLQQLVDAWPVPLREIRIIGHSMGGLVTRAACAVAERQAHGWRALLSDAVFLGSPHHGSPLERHGHRLQSVLSFSPYVAPLATLGRLRSAGITDLRHGSISEADAQRGDRFSELSPPLHVPLPQGVRCYAIAATTRTAAAAASHAGSDGLVPVASALGEHPQPERRLDFGPGRRWVGHGMNHWDVLADARVLAQLRRWLDPASNQESVPE